MVGRCSVVDFSKKAAFKGEQETLLLSEDGNE